MVGAHKGLWHEIALTPRKGQCRGRCIEPQELCQYPHSRRITSGVNWWSQRSSIGDSTMSFCFHNGNSIHFVGKDPRSPEVRQRYWGDKGKDEPRKGRRISWGWTWNLMVWAAYLRAKWPRDQEIDSSGGSWFTLFNTPGQHQDVFGLEGKFLVDRYEEGYCWVCRSMWRMSEG